MTPDTAARVSPERGARHFLFGDVYTSVTKFDVAIILLLMVFLFSAPVSIAIMNIGYGSTTTL